MDNTYNYQGFCGWHSLTTDTTQASTPDTPKAITPSKQIEMMGSALNPSRSLTQFADASQGVAATGWVASLESGGYAAIIGSPIWADSHNADLATEKNPAEALAAAYLTHGSELCRVISGPFAFVIADNKSQRFLAATDKLARYPVYYAPISNGIIFGSSPSAVLAHSGLKQQIREEGLYDYVYFHMVPSPVTVYEGMQKLQAGTLLEFDGQQINISNHWLPTFNEQPAKSLQAYGEELKRTLKASVGRAMAGEQRTGAFLSGGLDSSTVVGMMAELAETEAEAFSIGFSAEGYDEMAYARITAKHFGVKLNEYYVTPQDVVEALPLIATSYDEPFGNSSALPAYFCAKFAREQGIERLLAGDGGDELFAGNERYAKQKVFEKYQRIPKSLRTRGIEPAVKNLGEKFPLGSKAKSYIQQANTPLPDRLQSYNFLHRHLPSEIFSEDFLTQVDTNAPLALQHSIYHRPAEASALNKMLYLDWQLTLADNDLRKVSHMCALAGVDIVYPMLDDELVAFSTQIPSKLKLKGKKLRHFYKKSLTGWLPDATINKPKQGFGLPFGVWMQSHKPLQEMAYDNLVALKQRHYFNNDFLDKLITLHREGHAAYYGELIWILTVLEYWLQGKQND